MAFAMTASKEFPSRLNPVKHEPKRGMKRYAKTRWALDRLASHYILCEERASSIQSPLSQLGNGSRPCFSSRIPPIVEMSADLRPYHAAVQTVIKDTEMATIFYIRWLVKSLRKHGRTTDTDRAKALGVSRSLYDRMLDRFLTAVQAIVDHEAS